MAYSADSFVADEVPTTAKWNKLWNNDASFNDGSGIADDAIINRHILADAVKAAEMYFGMIYKRQGGSTTDWGTQGTTNYDTDAENVKIQTGQFTKTISGEESITFPSAYTYRPWAGVFMASANAANGFVRYKVGSTNTTTLGGIQCFSDAGSAISGEQVAWIAIGV